MSEGAEPFAVLHVLLQDTWVLGWRHEGDRLVFDVEFSLRPRHPAYVAPPPTVWTCYRRGWLVFEGVRDLHGLRRLDEVRPTLDPDGSPDYGNIDSLLCAENGVFLIVGDFGDVRLVADRVRPILANAAAAD